MRTRERPIQQHKPRYPSPTFPRRTFFYSLLTLISESSLLSLSASLVFFSSIVFNQSPPPLPPSSPPPPPINYSALAREKANGRASSTSHGTRFLVLSANTPPPMVRNPPPARPLPTTNSKTDELVYMKRRVSY